MKGKPAGRDAALVRLLQVIAVAANEARTIEGALQMCLDEVCAHTGWPVGHAYLVDQETGALLPTGVWHPAEDGRFRQFRENTAGTRLAAGQGLLGAVLTTGRPTWVADVTRDPTFVRATPGDIGVRAGRAFPIMAGSEVVGVLEFYSVEAAELDEALVNVMSQVGVQIGRVVERVRSEKALRLSEAKFAGIISTSSDAIISVDEGQRIILFNHGAEQIFGFPADEVLGRPLEMLIPERFRGTHAEQVRRFGGGPVAARRMGERGQVSGRRKSGEVFPADASISKLELDGQRVYTVVLRDITERVRAEQELARSNAELEQFAYVASHDLQEPLRMVASYTQLLARRYRGRLDSDAEDFIAFAVEGVTRMETLINDLLAFSRVGTRGIELEPVDTGRVLLRVLDDLAPAIEEAGAEVTHDPLPTVQADAMQLGQVFQNLVSNAIKFRSPAAGPRVHVSAERGPEKWVLSVRDNGIGIEREYAERIFVLFQRLHSRSEYPGTGIGLSICKKIVEQHGGRIWLESEPGAGAAFHFSIPDRTLERA
ncbi:MAG TPA: ATP-binding protein [Longimicrobiales bacterium]|nr:ATP-binding protein [Longimicrobiales bacterium]